MYVSVGACCFVASLVENPQRAAPLHQTRWPSEKNQYNPRVSPGRRGHFILVYLFFPALIFRTLSPVSSIWCAECTIRSSTAFATVGSPMASYQLDTGICEVMTMDFLPCLFSMMSSRIGCSLASSGTRKRSPRISSGHRSIFRSSVSII